MDRHISTPRYGAICVLTDTSRNDIEPQFDLIQPGRVGRGEVQVNFGTHRQEVRDWPALVRRLGVSRRRLFHQEHGCVTLIDSRSCIAAISRFRFFVPGVSTVQ